MNKKERIWYVYGDSDDAITYAEAIEGAESYNLDLKSWAKRFGWSKVDVNEMQYWRKYVQFRSRK